MKKLKPYLPILFIGIMLLAPDLGFCSVESTLSAIQSRLITTILPLMGILGIIWAAFSFFSGNPNAKNHLFLAIVGALIGFGAPSIIAFIRGLVN